MLVSHDRALLRGLCTRVWGLEHGHITDYDGSFEEWEARASGTTAARGGGRAGEAEAERRPGRRSRRHRAGCRAQARSSRRPRAARRALEQAEARVHALEAREAELDTELAGADAVRRPRRAPRGAQELGPASWRRVRVELRAGLRERGKCAVARAGNGSTGTAFGRYPGV